MTKQDFDEDVNVHKQCRCDVDIIKEQRRFLFFTVFELRNFVVCKE